MRRSIELDTIWLWPKLGSAHLFIYENHVKEPGRKEREKKIAT